MNPLRFVRGGLALLALATACDGSTSPPADPGPLVVHALLAAGKDSQFVDVGRATVLLPDVVPRMAPERGASVTFEGPAGQSLLVEIAPGHYSCLCSVVAGERYTLHVQTESGEVAQGVTHVPRTPHVSPASESLNSSQTIVELNWPSVTTPGRYGIYYRTAPTLTRYLFLVYTSDTTFRLQPLAGCDAGCCQGAPILVVAFSPSVLTERGFPAPPGSADTLRGAAGVVGSASADSAVFQLTNPGTC